ncbi:MAG: hypothetical protein IKL31_00210 [Ruminococcus sp.]|nr:hypothetical protein [Ruminococcus sp.]MBR6669158.1 hypothetical protein [Ruminococcus sp.]
MEMNNLSSINNAANAMQNLKVQNAVADYKLNKLSKDAEKETDAVKSSDAFNKEEQAVSSETGIYSKESIQKTVEEIEEQRKSAMSNMVREMLGQQAKAKGMDYIGLKPEQIVASAEDIEEAKASISEGGYWSVDAVAGRIMDMAELIANGDSSKLSMLKDAIIQGFGNAAKDFGRDGLDDMPDITKETYNEVMRRFDEFEKNLAGTAVEEE